MNRSYHLWTNEDKNYLIEYYGKIKASEISLNLNVSKNSVILMANKLGLKTNQSIVKRKYSFNDNFFSNINNTSSYFAGLMAADGNIELKRPRFHISLCDKILIESFAKCLNFNGKIYEIQPYNLSRLIQYKLSISSKVMVDDLKNIWNIIPRKSFILEPPKLTLLEHKLAFIVGYIDGDGCICNTSRFNLSCVGSFKMINWISEILGTTVNSHKHIFCTQVAREKAKDICKKLYQVETPIKLPRKWNKVKELL